MNKKSFSHTVSTFYCIAGVAAFLASLTWFFFFFFDSKLAANNMEAFLKLHQNPLIVVRFCLSMVSVLFSIIAFMGLYFRIKEEFYGLPLAALCFYILAIAIDAVYRAVELITVHFIWAQNYLKTTDEVVKSGYLTKINLFNEVGAGVMIMFGIFFAVARVLFGVCTWKVNRVLSISFLAAGLFNVVAYFGEFFSLPPLTEPWWYFYEVLMIFLYVYLGVWLIKNRTVSAKDSGNLGQA